MKLWVDDAHHNDLMRRAGEEYWKTLERFVVFVEEYSLKGFSFLEPKGEFLFPAK